MYLLTSHWNFRVASTIEAHIWECISIRHHVTLLMFVIAFLVYFGFLTMEILLNHGPSSDMGEFINNIAFLFGTLASILLVLILVRALGLVALFLWTIYVAWDVATKNSYRNAVCDVFNKVREKINGILGVQINAVELQPQPQRHIVVEIQEVEGQDVL